MIVVLAYQANARLVKGRAQKDRSRGAPLDRKAGGGQKGDRPRALTA